MLFMVEVSVWKTKHSQVIFHGVWKRNLSVWGKFMIPKSFSDKNIFHYSQRARSQRQQDTYILKTGSLNWAQFMVLLGFPKWHWIQWIMTKHTIKNITRNTPHLVIVTFWDEALQIKILLLCLDRYLCSVVIGKRYLPKGSKENVLYIIITRNVTM